MSSAVKSRIAWAFRSLYFFVFSVLLLAILLLYLSFNIFSSDVAVTVTDTLLTVFLYAILIWTYQNISEYERDQTELQEEVAGIQEKQTEIMKQQKDILIQNNQPDIEVRGLKIDNGEVGCELSNIGNGLAVNLGVYVNLNFSDDSLSVPITRVPLHKDPEENHRYGAILRPGEQKRFSGEIIFQTSNIEGLEENATYSELQTYLIESGFNDVNYDIGIVYEPINGDKIEKRQKVRSFIIDGEAVKVG